MTGEAGRVEERAVDDTPKRAPAASPARVRGDALVPRYPGLFSIYRLTQVLSLVLTKLWFGFHTVGRKNVPTEGPVVVVSNHQSQLDPFLLVIGLWRVPCFLAKDTLFRNRLLGAYLRKIGSIPIDRTAERGAVEGLRACLRCLKQGRLLGFFPEGTRSPDGKLQSLHSGIALLAKRSGAQIVPSIIVGSFEAWPRERKFPRRHPVRVVYGQPLRYERGESYDSFCARLETALRNLARSSGAEHLLREASEPVEGTGPAADTLQAP